MIQKLTSKEMPRPGIYLGIVISVISLLWCTVHPVISNEAMAQAPYLSTGTSGVLPGTNSTASAFCNDGDGMISGGYSTGLSSNHSTSDIMVYSNHPIQEINNSGYFEGWEAGLLNKGNASAQISSIVLCLNLTLTA